MNIKALTVFRWNNKLVEVVATTDRPVVFFKYLREEDKAKCECGKSIDEEIGMIVDSPLFRECSKPVETISQSSQHKEREVSE